MFQTGVGIESGTDPLRVMEAQAILKQLNVSNKLCLIINNNICI